jgi:hypothetical protein
MEIERIELSVAGIVNGLVKKKLIRMHKAKDGTIFFRIIKET